MFYNAKIHWRPGMALTDAVFRNMEASLDTRQRLVVRTALSDGRIGLLPDCPFDAEGSFVGRTYELNSLMCTAMLPSGNIVDINGELKITIPKLTEKEYFLCVGISDNEPRVFEREGVPFEEPVYELSLHTLNEIMDANVVPIKRFVIIDGTLTIDSDYIPPVLTVSVDKKYDDYLAIIVKDIEAIVSHPNLDNGEGKRILRNLLFRLNNFNRLRSVRHLVNMLQETAFTVKYYLVDNKEEELKQGLITEKSKGSIAEIKNGKLATLWDDARREPSMLNVASYIKWLDEWLKAQVALLDVVVIVDNSIDYDKLKQDIKNEVYTQLKEEIYEKMIAEMHDKLHERLTSELKDSLKTFIDEEILPRMKQEISDELRTSLYDRLYNALFKSLFDELYRPDDEEEEEFLPII